MSAGATRELVAGLADAGEQAVRSGLVLATGGNLSARLKDEDAFLVTAAGGRLDRISSGTLVTVGLDGVVRSGGVAPSSEWKLHQHAYLRRPDIGAVVHVHPQHAVLLDALGHRIRLHTLDHAAYVGSVGTTPYRPNGSDELAVEAAEQLVRHDCVVLARHGCSTVGPDIGMAFRRAVNLEEAAVATYRCLLLGDTTSEFPAVDRPALHGG